jgi:UDP-glucose 4-epimerase
MRKLIKGMDIVYHTACIPHEGLSVFSPHLVTQNTFGITMSVASAAADARIRRFINLSSMARYGKIKSPYKETSIPKPEDPYGVAKLASENALDILGKVHGFEVVHAIPHNIIGPRQRYSDPFRNVVAIMINLMLQGKQPFIYGDGKQTRCFSYVGDAVDSLVKMGYQDNVIGERINIGPDEETIAINELAKILAKKLNFKLKPIYLPDRPQEVKHATCSADKARKLLGYKTKTTLDQGLQNTIDYIKKRGTKKFEYHLDVEIVNDKTPKTWNKNYFK